MRKEEFRINTSKCSEEFKKRILEILEERGIEYQILGKDRLVIDYYPNDLEFGRAKVYIEWACVCYGVDWYDLIEV